MLETSKLLNILNFKTIQLVKKEVVWEAALGVLFSIFLGFFINHLEPMFYNIVTPANIPINELVGKVGFVGVVGFTIITVLLILRLTNYMKKRNATMILDLLNESNEVKVKDKFKEASKMLSKKHEIEGTVAVGGVTSDDLEGVLKGKSLKSLHKFVQNEDVNVIVATKEFPQGEIYGHEFVPIDRFFPDISDFKWN